MKHQYDADVDAHYFSDEDFDGMVSRTEVLTGVIVNIDYDEHDNVVGVEVL